MTEKNIFKFRAFLFIFFIMILTFALSLYTNTISTPIQIAYGITLIVGLITALGYLIIHLFFHREISSLKFIEKILREQEK